MRSKPLSILLVDKSSGPLLLERAQHKSAEVSLISSSHSRVEVSISPSPFKSTMYLVNFALLAALLLPASRLVSAQVLTDEFTVNCNPLTIQRSDPIVSPGVASGHVLSSPATPPSNVPWAQIRRQTPGQRLATRS